MPDPDDPSREALVLGLEGVHGFQELSEMFGLGERPTLDLVFDMWQRGHVVLDLARSAVLPSAHLDESRIAMLDSTEITEETRKVMVDRVTGHVLPVQGRRSAPKDARRIVPAVEAAASLRTVTASALLAALRRTLDDESRRSEGKPVRQKKVIGARLAFSQVEQGHESRWLKLSVACHIEPDDDLPHVELLERERLPAGASASLAGWILKTIENTPESGFAKLLIDNATTAEVEPPRLEDLLARMEHRVENLESVDVSLREAAQEELSELSGSITEALVHAVDSEVVTEVVATQDEHIEALTRLLREAQRQVVLVSPWVEEGPFTDLSGELRNAMDRGVRVFLLWGFGGDSELDGKAKNEIIRLQTAHTGLFHFSRKSSCTHAKLAIRDDREALISSLNFLGLSGFPNDILLNQ